jgi:uncharacterized protein YpuA (DUF1002 family)
MEYNLIIADIKDIMYDAKEAQARLAQYITDADRGINVNHVAQEENEPKAKTIENLFAFLIEAKYDMDRVKDDLKDLYNKLETLVEIVEYEAVRKEAGL